MKILSEYEVSTLELKSQGSGKYSGVNKVKEALDTLVIGQVLLIDREDWDRKSLPPSCINGWYSGSGSEKRFSSKSLKDETGWATIRVK